MTKKERIWRERYENSVKVMTEYYESVNRDSPVSIYQNVYSDEDYKNIIEFTLKCYEKDDDGWIRI